MKELRGFNQKRFEHDAFYVSKTVAIVFYNAMKAAKGFVKEKL